MVPFSDGENRMPYALTDFLYQIIGRCFFNVRFPGFGCPNRSPCMISLLDAPHPFKVFVMPDLDGFFLLIR